MGSLCELPNSLWSSYMGLSSVRAPWAAILPCAYLGLADLGVFSFLFGELK